MLTMHSRKGSERPLLKKQQSKKPNNKAGQLIQKFDLGLAAADSANLSLIFAFKQYLAEALAGLGHTLMFPFAAGASVIRASLALYQAKKEGYKKRAVLGAVVEMFAALGVVTAVAGSFIATALFATVAPIIFTAVSAAKTSYQAISAAYYGLKSYFSKEPVKKEQYKKMALAFGISAGINALATVAIGLVMVAGKLSFGILGIVAGAIGTIYATYQALRTKSSSEKAAAEPQSINASSTGRLYKTLGLKRSYSLDDLELRGKQGQTVQQPISGIELIKMNSSVALVAEAVVQPKRSRSFSL